MEGVGLPVTIGHHLARTKIASLLGRWAAGQRCSVSSGPTHFLFFLSLAIILGAVLAAGTAAYSQPLTSRVPVVPPAAPLVSPVSTTLVVTVTPAPPAVIAYHDMIVLQAGLSQQFDATVLNDPTNSGVNWSVGSVGCAPRSCGNIDDAGKYSAPMTPPDFGSDWFIPILIVATSVADPTKTGRAFVIVTPVPTAIAITPGNATVQINGAQQFALTGSPMGTVPSVTWHLSGSVCAGPDCGTIDSTGMYTAPHWPPDPPIVTITAISAVDASVTGSATVNLAPNPNNGKLVGHYAFLMSGRDYEGVYNFAGSFVADGTGKITNGKWDSISSSDAGLGSDVPFTGTYSVGSDGRGAMVLSTAPNWRGVIFSFALGSFAGGVANRGRIFEVEPGNPDTAANVGGGILARQDPTAFSTAAIAGGYAFAFNTPAQGSFHCRNLFANGRFTASNGALTAGQADVVAIANGAFCNVPSAYSADLSFSGTYSVDANGRGTAAFTFTGESPVFTNFAFYVVSATELFFVETDSWGPIPDLAHERAPLGGVARQQSGEPFSVSSLTGPAVLSVTDDEVQNNLGVSLATFDGIGTLTGTTDVVNNASSVVSTFPLSGTYTVDPDGLGRGVLTFSGDLSPKPFYLISPGKGFILDTTTLDPGVVSVGLIEPQLGGPFTNSSLSGIYILDVSPPYLSPLFSPGAGLLAAAGAGNLNGIADSPDGIGSGIGTTFAGKYSIQPNGRGTLTTSPNVGAPLNWMFYVADPSKILLRQAIAGGGQHATI
jgi:hypothetical protein